MLKNSKKLKLLSTSMTKFTLIFAMLCSIMVTSVGTISYATTQEDLEAKIEALKEANERLDSELAEIPSDIAATKEYQDLYFEKLQKSKEQIDLLNNELALIEQNIADKETAIGSAETDILDKENEIAKKDVKITSMQAENAKNLEKFGEIVSSMYMSESADIFSILAGSESFFDLFINVEVMQNITNQNQKFMDDLEAAIAEQKNMKLELENSIVAIANDKAALETQKSELLGQKASLEGGLAESTALSNTYNSNYYKYAGQISNLKERQEALNETMKANESDILSYEAKVKELIKQQQTQNEYVPGEWRWPLDLKYQMITTYFGYDAWRNGNHTGIDVGNSGIGGANIYAAKAGTVIIAKTTYIPGYSYGKYIVIDHGGTITSLYGHCSQVYVSVGQQVAQGDVIGAVGTTGWSTGNHLHFEVRVNGTPQNPFNYVNLPG